MECDRAAACNSGYDINHNGYRTNSQKIYKQKAVTETISHQGR